MEQDELVKILLELGELRALNRLAPAEAAQLRERCARLDADASARTATIHSLSLLIAPERAARLAAEKELKESRDNEWELGDENETLSAQIEILKAQLAEKSDQADTIGRMAHIIDELKAQLAEKDDQGGAPHNAKERVKLWREWAIAHTSAYLGDSDASLRAALDCRIPDECTTQRVDNWRDWAKQFTGSPAGRSDESLQAVVAALVKSYGRSLTAWREWAAPYAPDVCSCDDAALQNELNAMLGDKNK